MKPTIPNRDLINPSIAPDCTNEERTFRVTHPFHPLHGREFRLATYRHNWSESRVYYHDPRGKLTSLPAEWTDIAPPDPFVVISAGRSAFRAADLLDLAAFLEQLPAGGVKNVTSKM